MVYRKRRISESLHTYTYIHTYTHTHTHTHKHALTHACMQTNSIVKSPYSETTSSSDKELRVSRNPTVNSRANRSPSLLPTLSESGAQFSSFLRSILTLSTHLRLSFPSNLTLTLTHKTAQELEVHRNWTENPTLSLFAVSWRHPLRDTNVHQFTTSRNSYVLS